MLAVILDASKLVAGTYSSQTANSFKKASVLKKEVKLRSIDSMTEEHQSTPLRLVSVSTYHLAFRL